MCLTRYNGVRMYQERNYSLTQNNKMKESWFDHNQQRICMHGITIYSGPENGFIIYYLYPLRITKNINKILWRYSRFAVQLKVKYLNHINKELVNSFCNHIWLHLGNFWGRFPLATGLISWYNWKHFIYLRHVCKTITYLYNTS